MGSTMRRRDSEVSNLLTSKMLTRPIYIVVHYRQKCIAGCVNATSQTRCISNEYRVKLRLQMNRIQLVHDV